MRTSSLSTLPPACPPRTLNTNEAPEGYVAVLKASVPAQQIGNICRACDWRPTCQAPDTDFTAPGHRCMSYGVVTADGKLVERQDGCSVVFKRRQS